jgi:hypothetical protein
MNNEQKELLNEVYKKYQSQTMFRTDDLVSLEELDGMCLVTGEIKKVYRQYAPKEFINKCKTNTEFSEKWGLTIEELELDTDERNKWFQINLNGNNPLMKSDWKDYELNQQNIPTKLITITYNNKTIESYE